MYSFFSISLKYSHMLSSDQLSPNKLCRFAHSARMFVTRLMTALWIAEPPIARPRGYLRAARLNLAHRLRYDKTDAPDVVPRKFEAGWVLIQCIVELDLRICGLRVSHRSRGASIYPTNQPSITRPTYAGNVVL
jgi:hypothetical protein